MLDKLAKVQAALRAPKGQRNEFGGYNYRSCEDILEAVKPLLTAEGLVLLLSDDVVEVAGRHYVRATATVVPQDGSAPAMSVTALAREAAARKGMDDSQITGATSSYARKYALNGLFLIDDTRDADATNTHGHDERAPEAPRAPAHPNVPSVPPPARQAPPPPPPMPAPSCDVAEGTQARGTIKVATCKEKKDKNGRPYNGYGVVLESEPELWYNATSYSFSKEDRASSAMLQRARRGDVIGFVWRPSEFNGKPEIVQVLDLADAPAEQHQQNEVPDEPGQDLDY